MKSQQNIIELVTRPGVDDLEEVLGDPGVVPGGDPCGRVEEVDLALSCPLDLVSVWQRNLG